MRTQGEARFTGRWQDRSTSTSIVLDSIAKQRSMSTREAREFPDSTCVECGRKMQNGNVQKCNQTPGGFCSWHVPTAVREFMEEAILDNSRNKPEYSLTTSWVIGGIILALMLFGVYLGVQHGL